MRILLVEDDESIVEVLVAVLAKQNYVVDVAIDGEAGWEMVVAVSYDLVLLDVMLPKIDGISFCRQLRSRKNQVPVLLLTSRDTTTDKLLGLDSGADDYVIKPFNIEELVARIRALLRRGTIATAPVLEYGGLQLDPSTREVTYRGKPLQFSRKEYLLLELFLRNQQRVFSRRNIIDQLWSLGEDPPDEDTVKSHIKNIRRELKAAGVSDLIETLYGQGYRLNSVYSAETTETHSQPASTSAQPRSIDATVAEVWQRTKGITFERIAFLEQVVVALKTDTLTEALCQKAVENTHKLVGSLGMFGFEAGSQLAQQLEMLFEAMLEQQTVVPSPIQSTLAPLHGRLNQEIEWLVAALHRELATDSLAASDESGSIPSWLIPVDAPLLLIVDRDRDLAQSIVTEAIIWKMRVSIAQNIETAQQLIRQECPAVVLLDPALTQDIEAGQTLLTMLTQQYPPVPVLMLSAQHWSLDRVAAAKSGGQIFLQKPTTASQVLQAVAEVLKQPNLMDAKVLAVDDDPQILAALRVLLEPQGMHLTCLEDPTYFWETLKSVQPDLLILDIMMPNVSGVELCQSVRQDVEWNWLPILFLTARTDAEMLQQVFASGADDCVIKPILPEELSVRVLNRLKRSQLLRTQAETDSITGIFNRQQGTQALNQLLQLVSQAQQPLCLAAIDLDHFQQVNDRHSHLQGDRVLHQFGQFLKQKFRSGDVVARWGGEEFIVGMYGTIREDGTERLAEILEEWRSISLMPPNHVPLSVTFSAGIAQYPFDGKNLQTLYRTASAALYRAKVAGRDRVLSVDRRSPVLLTEQWVDVLLVYPEHEFPHLLLRALETRGYNACWLQSSKSALESLRGERSPLKAQVILLADSLSEPDMLEMLKQLGTQMLKQSLILLLLEQVDLVEPAKVLGASHYLLSPFKIPAVMQYLRQALRTDSNLQINRTQIVG
jgi:diguanylate cyclase (GGDEF)-like protein